MAAATSPGGDTTDRHESPANAARTLRLTVLPWADFQDEMLERADTAEDDDADERVVAFEDAGAVQRLLTPMRLELLEAVMREPPESLRGLAARLDRTPSEVHGDVHRLEEYGIIHLETVGRAKRPTVPYEAITIEVPTHSTATETMRWARRERQADPLSGDSDALTARGRVDGQRWQRLTRAGGPRSPPRHGAGVRGRCRPPGRIRAGYR